MLQYCELLTDEFMPSINSIANFEIHIEGLLGLKGEY